MSTEKRKSRARMSFGSRNAIRISHSFRNIRGLHHRLLVHLCPMTKWTTMVRTLDLSLHIHTVVGHMNVVSVLHALSFVEITPVFVMRTSWVASSYVISIIS